MQPAEKNGHGQTDVSDGLHREGSKKSRAAGHSVEPEQFSEVPLNLHTKYMKYSGL